MTEVYLWSDSHWNHKGILDYCEKTRPYADVVEMNEALIEKWNSKVTAKDIVWLLGDFAFSEKNSHMTNDYIFKALKGQKNLIVGNHDEKNKSIMKLGWNEMKFLHTIRWSDGTEKIRVNVCHYPLETWKNAQHGYMMAHGHSHGTMKRIIPRRFDVGVDAMGIDGPINIIDLWNIGMSQEYDPADHHGAD